MLWEFSPSGKFMREIGPNDYAKSFAHSVRIDKDDNIFVGSVYLNPNGGARGEGPTSGENDRGIVVANAISGALKYFIPDPGDLQGIRDAGRTSR